MWFVIPRNTSRSYHQLQQWWTTQATTLISNIPLPIVTITSGYAMMVHGRGCNPHRSMTTFANLEITSLWRHWWRHNAETIRDREKRRPPRAMKSSELANGENRIALRQLLQNRKWRHWWRHNLGSRWKLQKWLEKILVLVRSTI